MLALCGNGALRGRISLRLHQGGEVPDPLPGPRVGVRQREVLPRCGHPQQDRGRGHGYQGGRRLSRRHYSRPRKGRTAPAQTYEWSEEYPSQFWRDGRGPTRSIPPYFMPVVRDVPLFPEGDVQPNGTWTAGETRPTISGLNFGIPKPFQFPITADYTYVGREKRDGIDCAIIAIDYEIFHEVIRPAGTTGCTRHGWPATPTRSTGGDRAGGQCTTRRPSISSSASTTGDEVEYTGDADGCRRRDRDRDQRAVHTCNRNRSRNRNRQRDRDRNRSRDRCCAIG